MKKILVWIERDENAPRGKKEVNATLVVLNKATGDLLKYRVGDMIHLSYGNTNVEGSIVKLPRGCIEIKSINNTVNLSLSLISSVIYNNEKITVYQ